MASNEGAAALQRARERWNAGDLEGYLQIYADDAVLHGYDGVGPGIADIRAFYQAFFAAFPDATLHFDDVIPAGDMVTCRFVVRGTHEGPFQGLPATHRTFSIPGITILRFARGKCVERWSQADFLSLLQQLGAIPGEAPGARPLVSDVVLDDHSGMPQPNDVVRDHLARALQWEEAHVGFEKALAGLPAPARGTRPPGLAHSVWELLEHIRIAQDDILAFCVNANYEHTMTWPGDYWPGTPAPPDDAAWDASIAAVVRSRSSLQALTRDVADLTARVPTGNATQTYLRAVLLAADHVAYHVGQIVQVRKALGVWG